MHDPPRILIVDDHETNRDILATRLATQGYDLCQQGPVDVEQQVGNA
jgi:CheY-like chemotaxis protein